MKVLLLCSSHNDLGLIRALIKLGCEIVVTGNVENLPGQKFADKFIKADYSDRELILDIARREKIDRIVPCCHDFALYTSAYVAEKLNLPGMDSLENVLTIHNKDRFKNLAFDLEIRTPKSHGFNNFSDAENFLRSAKYPMIMKPVDSAGGKGVNRADDFESAQKFLPIAFDHSKSGRIVIEPYLTGSQHGFCTFLVNQKVRAICSNNEYSILNPWRVEIDTFPASNFDQVKDELVESIEKIARTLKLKDGIFHLQYIMQNGEPWIIETMRRILGNMYFIPGNALTGIDWEYWETRARLDLSLENFPMNVNQEGFFSYKTILANRNGRIKKIDLRGQFQKNLFYEFWLKSPGDEITRFNSEQVGFLFSMFRNREEMNRALIENYLNDFVEMEVQS